MKPTAIITGDIHLREDAPICRTDDYFGALIRKLTWLCALQRKHNCPILDSGDMFNGWKSSPYLLQQALNHLPKGIITIPGNHDLPAHNIELFHKSSLSVLEAADFISVAINNKPIEFSDFVLYPFPWGYEPARCPTETSKPKVALMHIMTYQGEMPWPGCVDSNSKQLLRTMRGYDLVITGHNHKPFIEEFQDRKLVNPGSLMRMSTTQADHQPRVYLWYAESNELEAVYVPIEKDVVSRDHIEHTENRDARMDAFVNRLDGEFEVSLSFEGNLEEFFATNRVRQGVKNIVWESVKGA